MSNQIDPNQFKTKGYDNNHIAITLVLGIVGIGILWYGFSSYMAPPPPARTIAVTPAVPVAPTGQAPDAPLRP